MRLLSLVPACLMRFPDGMCFYWNGQELRALDRLHYTGWYAASLDELTSRWRRYWRQLPVRLTCGKNWW